MNRDIHFPDGTYLSLDGAGQMWHHEKGGTRTTVCAWDVWPNLVALASAPVFTEIAPSHIGRCRRCNAPWADNQGRWPGVSPHRTPVGGGQECFPLCTLCWNGLTARETLSYYRALWTEWQEAEVGPGRTGLVVHITWEALAEFVINEPGASG